MRNLSRKSWCIRVLRYAELVPQCLFQMDPSSAMFRKILKSWVCGNIEKDGDFIFKGKLRKEKNDWLSLEVAEWRRRSEHEKESQREQLSIEEEEGWQLHIFQKDGNPQMWGSTQFKSRGCRIHGMMTSYLLKGWKSSNRRESGWNAKRMERIPKAV